MSKFFNPSTLASIVRYFQNVAITLSQSFVNAPEQLQKFIDGISGFFEKLWKFIPTIPDFDVRFNFVAMATITPLIIDIIFIFLTQELILNIIQLFTLCAAFGLFYPIAFIYRTNGTFEWYHIFILIISAIYLCAVVTYSIIKKHGKRENITGIIDQIKNFYMSEIIPECTTDFTQETLDVMLDEYEDDIIIDEAEPNWLNIGFSIILLAGASVFFSWSIGAFGNTNVVSFFQWIFIVVSFIIIICVIFVLVMIIFPCCRGPFVKVRAVLKSLALRIVLMVLDFLYVPACDALLEALYPKEYGCPAGTYMSYTREGSLLGFITDPKWECKACSTLEGVCGGLCDGLNETVAFLSPHLKFIHDVAIPCGISMVFGFVIMFGLPALWAWTIIHNRQIMWSVPVFGVTEEEKWMNLSNKMKTPGIFLFYMYRNHYSPWGIIVQCSKFVAVIIALISERVSNYVAFALLILHLAMFAANWIVQPYIVQFNNTLDTLTAFLNALLAIVPICAAFSKTVPSWFSIPLSAAVCVLPLFSLPYAFFCAPKKVWGQMYDPLKCYDQNGEEVEDFEGAEDQMLKLDSTHFLALWQLEEQEKMMEQSEGPFVIYGNDIVVVRRGTLREKITEMNKKISDVADATSTRELQRVLNLASIFAAIGAAWFLGCVAGDMIVSSEILC